MADSGKDYDAIIVGLGKTGLSCARYLTGQGLSFAIADSRPEPPELGSLQAFAPETPVYTGVFDAGLFCSTKQLILSPGIAVNEPAVRQAADAGVEVIGDIELFARQAPAPVVAVTGSNGKSTVATLIAEMIGRSGLRAELGGNIGTPVLDLLTGTVPDFYVLELSSFQLETVHSLRPAVAVVLNVSADHMNRYPDLAAYTMAKQRIYEGARVMVVNYDDPGTACMRQHDRHVIGYSRYAPEGSDLGLVRRHDEVWLAQGAEALMPLKELRLSGSHNVSNALAALALGSAIDLPLKPMLGVLRSFTGLPHRCQRVAIINGVEWINDSKGTNVGAACAAITGLGGAGNLVWIAGGDGKAADFSPLAEAVHGRVHTAVLIGRDAALIAEAVESATTVLFATTLEAAVNTAAGAARTGDRVLLSPACASFDMFRGYQERGEAFIEAVRGLPREGKTS